MILTLKTIFFVRSDLIEFNPHLVFEFMQLGERVFEFTRHKIITLKYKVYLIIELIHTNYFYINLSL